MPAHDRDAGLGGFGRGALEDLNQHFDREQLIRKADDAERRDRFPAHGIDVAERVRRGNRAELARIVDDRREEIGGEDDRQVVVDFVNGGVIGRRGTDQHIGIGDRRERAQQRQQIPGRLLGGATGALGKLRESNRRGHR